MSVLSEKLGVIKKKMDDERAARIEAGKKLFREAFVDFFAAHPEVTALRWRQYTPYFNDGDPCLFRVGDLTACLLPISADGEVNEEDHDGDSGEDDDYYLSSWDLRETHAAIKDDLKAMSSVMDEDVLLEMFDDHKIVTIPREGDAIVEEYSHD